MKKRQITWVLIASLTLLLTAHSGFAQRNDEEVTQKLVRSGEPDSETKNKAFKINLLQTLNGNIPIIFEWQFAPKLSLEASLGYTTRDVIDIIKREIQGNFWGRTFRLTRPGFSASAGLRYYFSNESNGMKGWYFSPVAEFRQYNDLVSVCNDWNSTTPTNPYLSQQRNHFYGRLIFGKQLYTKSNFIMDVYTGVGLRLQNDKIVECELNSNFEERFVIIENINTVPVFSLGFKIGFGW